MKKSFRILSLLIAAALLLSALSFSAFAEDEKDAEILTVLNLSDGSSAVVSDAPDIAGIAAAAEVESLSVTVDGESVLDADLSGAENAVTPAYISVSFPVPDTSKEVFLAGLTAENAESVKDALLAAYTAGKNFDLEDLDFIDAEKTYNKDGDDELCWAAASSNLLVHSGWAKKAGFTATDDLFELFIDSFDNHGGNAVYGIPWFFNGYYPGQNNDNFAKVKDYPNTGGYLTDYPAERYVASHDIYDSFSKTGEMFRKLRDGNAIALSLELYKNGSYSNGHSTTLFGYVVDTAYTPDDAAYYDVVIIADSDSDELTDADRREAKNKLNAYSLSPLQSGSYSTFSFRDDYYQFVMTDYTALLPYSDDYVPETDERATKNKNTTPDPSVIKIFLTDDSSVYEFKNEIPLGSNVYFTPVLNNESDVNFRNSVSFSMKVTGSKGNSVYSRTVRSTFNVQSPYYSYFNYFDLGAPEEDVYTVEVTITPSGSDAYYVNNSFTASFTVGEPTKPTEPPTEPQTEPPTEPTQPAQPEYKIGDANGDGHVDVVDVTTIQRYIAMLIDENEIILKNADVTDGGSGTVDIVDATYIQRYLALITNLDGTPYTEA